MFGCFFLYPFAMRMRYKFGIRATVLFAGVLLLPLFILSPMVPTMNLLFLTFSIPFAISGSIIDCATFTTILKYFEKYKGVAFGTRLGSNALGTIMYSFIFPILLTEIGWERTFWILIGICFITMCYGLLHNDSPSASDCTVGTPDGDVMPKDITQDDVQIYYRLLKNKECIVFLTANTIFCSVVFMPPVFMVSLRLSSVFWSLLDWSLLFFFPSFHPSLVSFFLSLHRYFCYLTQVQFATNLGHHITKSKWLMIIRGLTAVMIRFPAGYLGDIASRRKKMRFIALAVILLFSISTIICALTTSFSMLMLYMAFVSIVDSIHWVTLPLLVSEITKDIHSDNAVALFNCIGSFATLGGPPALGKSLQVKTVVVE